jgi:hypothetical protein
MKQFFKQNEIAAQLQKCQNAVQELLVIFKVSPICLHMLYTHNTQLKASVNVSVSMTSMAVSDERRHHDLVTILEEHDNESDWECSCSVGTSLTQMEIYSLEITC